MSTPNFALAISSTSARSPRSVTAAVAGGAETPSGESDALIAAQRLGSAGSLPDADHIPAADATDPIEHGGAVEHLRVVREPIADRSVFDIEAPNEGVHVEEAGVGEHPPQLPWAVDTNERPRVDRGALDAVREHSLHRALLEQLAPEDAPHQDLREPVVEGAPVVDDDARCPPGAQDAPNLAQRSGHVGRVVQYAVARDDVELPFPERKPLGVAMHDPRGQVEGLDVAARELHVARGEVDPCRPGAGGGVLDEVDPLAAADVQHVQAGGRLIRQRFSHPGGVGASADQQLLDRLTRAGRRRDIRPAGVGRPLLHGFVLGGIFGGSYGPHATGTPRPHRSPRYPPAHQTLATMMAFPLGHGPPIP